MIMIMHDTFSVCVLDERPGMKDEIIYQETCCWQDRYGLIHSVSNLGLKNTQISSNHCDQRLKNVGQTCGQTQRVMGGRRTV